MRRGIGNYKIINNNAILLAQILEVTFLVYFIQITPYASHNYNESS